MSESGDKKAAGSSTGSKKDDAKKEKPKSVEEILNGFNALRNEQRSLASKICEIESDLNEHKIVIETLKETEQDRKCFRMIGGVLVEGTVHSILPSVITNYENMKSAIESLNKKLVEKGKEILEYKEKYQIQFRNTASLLPEQGEPAGDVEKKHAPGVLVPQKS